MKMAGIVLVALVVLIAPASAQAFCFQMTNFGVLNMEVGTTSGQFTSLIGEADLSSFFGAGKSFPATGTAHLGANGQAHVGVVIASGDTSVPAYIVELFLAPPSFSGTGRARQTREGSGAGFTFNASMVNCSALPQ
jgi:hypothetical protein